MRVWRPQVQGNWEAGRRWVRRMWVGEGMWDDYWREGKEGRSE